MANIYLKRICLDKGPELEPVDYGFCADPLYQYFTTDTSVATSEIPPGYNMEGSFFECDVDYGVDEYWGPEGLHYIDLWSHLHEDHPSYSEGAIWNHAGFKPSRLKLTLSLPKSINPDAGLSINVWIYTPEGNIINARSWDTFYLANGDTDVFTIDLVSEFDKYGDYNPDYEDYTQIDKITLSAQGPNEHPLRILNICFDQEIEVVGPPMLCTTKIFDMFNHGNSIISKDSEFWNGFAYKTIDDPELGEVIMSNILGASFILRNHLYRDNAYYWLDSNNTSVVTIKINTKYVLEGVDVSIVIRSTVDGFAVVASAPMDINTTKEFQIELTPEDADWSMFEISIGAYRETAYIPIGENEGLLIENICIDQVIADSVDPNPIYCTSDLEVATGQSSWFRQNNTFFSGELSDRRLWTNGFRPNEITLLLENTSDHDIHDISVGVRMIGTMLEYDLQKGYLPLVNGQSDVISANSTGIVTIFVPDSIYKNPHDSIMGFEISTDEPSEGKWINIKDACFDKALSYELSEIRDRGEGNTCTQPMDSYWTDSYNNEEPSAYAYDYSNGHFKLGNNGSTTLYARSRTDSMGITEKWSRYGYQPSVAKVTIEVPLSSPLDISPTFYFRNDSYDVLGSTTVNVARGETVVIEVPLEMNSEFTYIEHVTVEEFNYSRFFIKNICFDIPPTWEVGI